MKNRISVVGLGPVGLSLATVNAKRGFTTIGVDVDNKKIANLKRGKIDFFEPKLNKMLTTALQKGRLQFTSDLDYAIKNSDITFLTVGTPLRANEIDLSHIKNAIQDIKLSLTGKNKFHLLAIKSTLPPLTTTNLILPILKNLINRKKTDVVINPEFLREGFVISNLLKPHLIVIGSSNRQSSLILEEYYQKFYKNVPEILHTNIPTAELIKYANNAFLATKISFINSMGAICQNIPGCDVNSVAHAIGKDSRIGPQFLKAGPGFGGSCLPKDLVGLIRLSEKIGEKPVFFKAVKNVNDSQFLRVIDLMREQNVLKKNNAATVLGLAFKKNTDDIREAISIKMIWKLLECGLNVKVHDPMALENFRRIFGTKISYHTSLNDSLKNSDCCIILTEWNMYKNLTPDDFMQKMRTCNVIDARRIFDTRLEGINFRAIGLGNRTHE